MRMGNHTWPIIFLSGIWMLWGCSKNLKHMGEPEPEVVKNVIMIIGDGMGPQQVGLLQAYAKQSAHSVLKNRQTAFERMLQDEGILGLSSTHAANVLVPDSAASGSQLASGKPSGSEMIGSDPNGNPTTSILEIAMSMNKSTGLVSDTRITHATPAAFAAHQTHRSLENEIAIDMLNLGPDVMFSGGLRHWIPAEANDKESEVFLELNKMTGGSLKIKSKRTDSRHLIIEAQQKGYSLAFTKSQMMQSKGKTLGLFAYSALPDGILETKTKNDPHRSIPTLKEMSEKALQLLSQNKNGFFLMIEAGQIDWAAHNNDTGTMLHEMLRINETLNYVLDWAKNRNDTLIVVTADHETGGFGFTYSGTNLPEPKNLPGQLFKGKDYKPNFNFGSPEILNGIYRQKRSYYDIFNSLFDKLSPNEQTPHNLMEIVNQNTEFHITVDQASRILEKEDNPLYVEGHKYLWSKEVPKLDCHDSFFVYQMGDNRQNLLAIQVEEKQMVTWSTGTHTATPVLVFAKGPPKVRATYGQIMHHTQLAQKTINALRGQ